MVDIAACNVHTSWKQENTMSHLDTPLRKPRTVSPRRTSASARQDVERPEIDLMAKALAAAVRSVSRADQRLVLDRLRQELSLDSDAAIAVRRGHASASVDPDDTTAPLTEQTYARRRALVEKGELLTSADLIDRVGITRQALSNRLANDSIFYVDGGRNERYYPAFFADAALDTKAVRKVSKALGDLPGASKWMFFTSPRESLGGLTPLDVLAGKRPAAGKTGYATGELERVGLDTVLKAAASVADA
jgi:hypothetical protein